MKYEDIKDLNQRCEEHPDHQTGMISGRMIEARLSEEIHELRAYIEAKQEQRSDSEQLGESVAKYSDIVSDGGFDPRNKQEQGDPVAWMTIDSNGEEDDIWYENPEGKLLEGWTYKPLYTTPQPKQEQGEPWGACVSGRVFVGALPEHVRKLSDDEGLPIQWLYTTPQPKQEQGEPVAWAKDLSHELLGVIIDVEEGDGFDKVCLNTIKRVCSQLATPQQRTWVGLTPLNIEDEYVRNYLWERALIAIDDPCCRSHPHENMNEYCQHKTELARAQNKLAQQRPQNCGTSYCSCIECVMDEQEQGEPVAWKWHQAPIKTSWGHKMVVADVAIDKDNTVSVYCERDQTAKVEAMFNAPAQPQQRKPLTADQIWDIAKDLEDASWRQIVDAVEAAHGIKE